MPRMTYRPTVLVRGSGDVGSAVAFVLHRAGYEVAIDDVAAPSAPRRGMALADAIFNGDCELDSVKARRIDDIASLLAAMVGGAAKVFGLGPRPRAIGEGVLCAIRGVAGDSQG